MRQEQQKVAVKIPAMSREELADSLMRVLGDLSDALSELDSRNNIEKEMCAQLTTYKERLEKAEKENEFFKKENKRLTEQLTLRKNDLFGRSSEKNGQIDADDAEDPLAEDAVDPATEPNNENKGSTQSEEDAASSEGNKASDTEGKKTSRPGKKPVGERAAALDKLPKHYIYQLDIEKFDALYGKGNWGIAYWDEVASIERTRPITYVNVVRKPIISAGLERELHRPTHVDRLIRHSLFSPSFWADVMHNKIMLCIPIYRLEAEFQREGIPITRQTIARNINRLSLELFGPVYDHMKMLLKAIGYHNVDETTLQVINDGRKPGSKSYMWVHVSGELVAGNAIIHFDYEPTRGTNHLRSFYDNYKGVITSDAYQTYGILCKESDGDIMNSNCWMHGRRRFVICVRVLNQDGVPEKIAALRPEYKALKMIQEIYALDTPLKEAGPKERLAVRQQKIRPKVEAFFAYMHELKADETGNLSEQLASAVNYCLEHERELCLFLDDPFIPIDNGQAERCIRPFAVGRRNWLFSFSKVGAQALAILYTLAQTALACGSDPYYYFKYLLEKMPCYMDGKDRSFLPDMMPWSDVYREYEAEQKYEAIHNDFFDAEPPKPKTPPQCRRPLDDVQNALCLG